MSARTQAYREKLRNGEYDLSWMTVDSEWGIKATPSQRGLTLDDINVGSYGVIPQKGASDSFAPRGADFHAEELPKMGYTLNTKGEAWADNMGKLYEEAVARQWSSTRDIPWHTLAPLPSDMEHAMSQLCTFFTEVEFIAGDVPGFWLSQINNTYHETKLFMATQIMDEARHLEVFRKRALANGGGLGKCPAEVEEGLKYIFDLRSFPQMLARLHLFGEGRVLTLFRLGELIAQNEAEKTIFRLCAQDESRHLAFGCLQLRMLIEEDPDRIEEIHEALDIAEERTLELGVTPEQVEPLLILLGGGEDKMDEGNEKFAFIRRKIVQEYLQRCHSIGLGRLERCSLKEAKDINLI
ncbi:hypothetical protein NKDENANG_01946 [Candidatus Entotheonellaceae bacterium PAL068K]